MAAIIRGVAALHREAHGVFPAERKIAYLERGLAGIGAANARIRADLPELR